MTDPVTEEGGPDPERELEALRERIRRLDVELVERAAERIALARKVGEAKRRRGQATVDYGQERIVLERARTAARERGLDAGVATDLFAGLIRAAVIAQDEDNLRASEAGAGRSAVVVGGAGRMGRWVARFLAAQGFDAHVLGAALPDAALVVCSTPPQATAALYAGWAASRPPAGVVVDIASIKTPLVAAIRALQAAGGRVASIHPLFGPSTVLLRDADVVVCDTGDEAATAAVEELFAYTTARLVRMSLEEHDRVMADLLSLAHATAIAFAAALPPDEHPVRSTTFRALEALAAHVVRESPDVYYEIQAMNPHSAAALDRLRAAVERMSGALASRDPAAFRGLLDEGRRRTPAPGGA
jgi:chorismate mutase/prephenate dehydrogenase